MTRNERGHRIAEPVDQFGLGARTRTAGIRRGHTRRTHDLVVGGCQPIGECGHHLVRQKSGFNQGFRAFDQRRGGQVSSAHHKIGVVRQRHVGKVGIRSHTPGFRYQTRAQRIQTDDRRSCHRPPGAAEPQTAALACGCLGSGAIAVHSRAHLFDNFLKIRRVKLAFPNN